MAVLGEFLGSACWITTPRANYPNSQITAAASAISDAQEYCSAVRPLGGNASDTPVNRSEASDRSAGLGALLEAIDHEVGAVAEAALASVTAEFAAAIADVVKDIPSGQRGPAIAAIKRARAAAMAAVKRNVADLRAGRKKAAIMTHSSPKP